MGQSIIGLLPAIAGQFPILTNILMILGSLVVVGQALVAVLPSKTLQDDWAKIQAIPIMGSLLSILTSFAVIQKK